MSRHISNWWSPEIFFRKICRNFSNVKRTCRKGSTYESKVMTISNWPLTTVVRRNVSSTSKCPSVTPNVFSYRPSYIFRKRERSQSLNLIFDFENSAKSFISEPFILNLFLMVTTKPAHFKHWNSNRYWFYDLFSMNFKNIDFAYMH